VRPYESRGPLAAHPAEMPLIKGQSRLSKFRHGLGGIDQVCIIAFLATEMLPPQLKAKIARELPSAVAETAWV
jgi:hypothetical protein